MNLVTTFANIMDGRVMLPPAQQLRSNQGGSASSAVIAGSCATTLTADASASAAAASNTPNASARKVHQDCLLLRAAARLTEIVHADGYCWLKYGEKRVTEKSLLRSYYKCAWSKASVPCVAKKVVDVNPDHPLINSRTQYSGAHNHAETGAMPKDLRGKTAGAAGAGAASGKSPKERQLDSSSPPSAAATTASGAASGASGAPPSSYRRTRNRWNPQDPVSISAPVAAAISAAIPAASGAVDCEMTESREAGNACDSEKPIREKTGKSPSRNGADSAANNVSPGDDPEPLLLPVAESGHVSAPAAVPGARAGSRFASPSGFSPCGARTIGSSRRCSITPRGVASASPAGTTGASFSSASWDAFPSPSLAITPSDNSGDVRNGGFPGFTALASTPTSGHSSALPLPSPRAAHAPPPLFTIPRGGSSASGGAPREAGVPRASPRAQASANAFSPPSCGTRGTGAGASFGVNSGSSSGVSPGSVHQVSSSPACSPRSPARLSARQSSAMLPPAYPSSSAASPS
ncbi:unnamed protein product, partial [Closterium sp. NIES-64]